MRAMSARIDLAKSENDALPVMAKLTMESSMELKALPNRLLVCPAMLRAESR